MKIPRGVMLATGAVPGRPNQALRIGSRHLVPIANRPLLFHGLDGLCEAGVQEAVVVVDPEEGPEIREAVGSFGAWDMEIRFAESPTGEGLDVALGSLLGPGDDAPTVVRRADVLVRGRLATQLEVLADEGLDALGLRVFETGWQVSAGCVLGPRALELLARSSARVTDPVTRVERGGGLVSVRDVDGCRPWHGGREALLAANRRVLQNLEPSTHHDSLLQSTVEGPVVAHPSARIESSVVRGPAIIGANARIVDAYIGPFTSIGDDVTVEGSEIEHSIVLDGAQLRYVGQRVDASIIGRGARVTSEFRMPRALRLMLGDGAEVLLP